MPEHVGSGDDVTTTHVARIELRDKEAPGACAARFRRWLSTIPLPAGARFGVERDFVTEDPAHPKLVGYRSYVLVGDAEIRTLDVDDAAAQVRDGGFTSVMVRLTDAGGRRFAELTRSWVHRRIAIVVDGMVESAPIVMGPIPGGRMNITMGAGDPNTQLIEARRLARRLGGR